MTTTNTYLSTRTSTESDLFQTQTEFNIAVAAKNGDAEAWLALWNKYRPVIMSILSPVLGYSREEKESEAYELFAHKLNIFDPIKIGVTPISWTFSFMITGGAKNRRDRLINESRSNGYLNDNAYDENPEEDDTHAYSTLSNLPSYETMKYSVETLYIKSHQETETARVKRLYANLNSFQKDVLRLRRAGYLLREIAQELDCSLSRVKDNLREAKLIAGHIFEVEFA